MPAQNDRDQRMELLGRLMRDWRDEHDLTQAEAATQAELNPATWGYIERGDDPDRQISARAIRGIGRVIGLPPLEAMRLAGREPDLADAARDDLIVLTDALAHLTEVMAGLEHLRSRARAFIDHNAHDDPDDRDI